MSEEQDNSKLLSRRELIAGGLAWGAAVFMGSKAEAYNPKKEAEESARDIKYIKEKMQKDWEEWGKERQAFAKKYRVEKSGDDYKIFLRKTRQEVDPSCKEFLKDKESILESREMKGRSSQKLKGFIVMKVGEKTIIRKFPTYQTVKPSNPEYLKAVEKAQREALYDFYQQMIKREGKPQSKAPDQNRFFSKDINRSQRVI